MSGGYETQAAGCRRFSSDGSLACRISWVCGRGGDQAGGAEAVEERPVHVEQDQSAICSIANRLDTVSAFTHELDSGQQATKHARALLPETRP